MQLSEAEMLRLAQQSFHQGHDEEALNNISAILHINPKNCAANNLAAKIFLKKGNLEYAGQAIDMAFESEANNKETQVLYVDLLVERHKLFEAWEAGNRYLKAHRSDNEFRYKLAVICTRIGNVEEAVSLLQEYIRKKGSDPFAWLNLGHMFKAQSKMDNAVEVYRQFIDLKPDMDGMGYWHIADIKDKQFSVKDVNRLERSIALEKNIYNLSLLNFALGTHYDKLKDFDKAFDAFSKANELHSTLKPFNAKAFSRFISSLESFSRTESFDFEVRQIPIFIVGMPRSGSTLCERILSSHSEVIATDELSFINFMAAGLERTGNYARSVEALTAEQCLAMRNSYFEDTKGYRKQKHRFFIDKNPTNFLHIPLIKKLFPEALIIHTFRDLMDNSFSIFKRYFFYGHEYGYSFNDLEKYYQGYVKLMAVWEHLFPGSIFHLSYENLVSDSESLIDALLEYCHLEKEQGCYEFYKNKKAVLTPSVDQVSKPIYKKAVGSWKPYEKYIGRYASRFADYYESLRNLSKTQAIVDTGSEPKLKSHYESEARNAWSDYWTQGHITSFGEKFANNYQGSIRRYWRELFSGLSEGSIVLDIATGNGALLEIAKEEIAHSAVELIGIDYAVIPDEVISQRVGIKMFPETSAESLPFKAHSVGVVISQYGVEYADFTKAIKEISRVLDTNGIVRFICHCEQSVVLKDNQLIYDCSKELLADNGAAQNLQLLLKELDHNNNIGVMNSELAEKHRFALNTSLAQVHDKYGDALFGTGFVEKMKSILSSQAKYNKQSLFKDYLDELRLSQKRLEDLFSAGLTVAEQQNLATVFAQAGLELQQTKEIIEADFGIVGLAVEAIKKKVELC